MFFMSSVSLATSDVQLEASGGVLVRNELLVDLLDVLAAARLLEQQAALRGEQRKILHGKDDRLLVAVVHVLVIGPGGTKERVALFPLDLGRLRVVLVLHHVEALALEHVVDRERSMPMRLESLPRIQDRHADE